MSVQVGVDEKKGTTTIRHSWRITVFSEFGDDPLVVAHRQEVVFDTETGDVVKKTRDRTVERRMSALPPQIQKALTDLGSSFDTYEVEDLRAEERNRRP